MKKKPENEAQNPLEASNLAFFGTQRQAHNPRRSHPSATPAASTEPPPPPPHAQPPLTRGHSFPGTMCVEGEGKGFLVLTGDDTIIGRIAQLASGTENQDTPIHIEIHKFIFMITFLGEFMPGPGRLRAKGCRTS